MTCRPSSGQRAGRRALVAVTVAAVLGVLSVTLGGEAPARAQAPAAARDSPATERSAGDTATAAATDAATATAGSCPASNPPDTLKLVDGTPQTTRLGQPFTTPFQTALASTDGCPLTTDVAGIAITFTAPTGGASGTFAASGTNAATVGSDASGAASAPNFTADDISGRYTITANSAYGSVAFTVTNAGPGLPARIAAVPSGPGTGTAGESTRVNHRYPLPLGAEVTDAAGTPLAGMTVTFAVGGDGASAAAGRSTPSASFLGGGSEVSETTDARGRASSPVVLAGPVAGPLTVTATVQGVARVAHFTLRAAAGPPATLTLGAGSGQSAATGGRFQIHLAVTVIDADGNLVAHALVRFTAPGPGAGARFHTARGARRAVSVATDASGVAVAPALVADREAGGYVVTAAAGHAHRVAFALVNRASGAP